MKASSGNILFLILIAVALFAALSYAVTQTNRSSSDGLSKDKAKLAASSLIQYTTQLEQAITKMKLFNSCSDNQISFERAPFDGSDTNYVNPNAPSDFKCHLFHTSGGAIPYKDNDAAISEYNIEFVSLPVAEVGTIAKETVTYRCVTSGIRSECSDLVAILKDVNELVCKELLKKLSMIEEIETGAIDTSSGLVYHKGNFNVGHDDIWAPTKENRGQPVGCYKHNSSGDWHYYHAILVR